MLKNPTPSTVLSADIAAVRHFTRTYTQRMGVLHRRLLGTPFSVTEARVLFEIAGRESPKASEVANALDLDPAYLSRILQRLARDGLIDRLRDSSDRRGLILALTDAGRDALDDINARSDTDVGRTLASFDDEERNALVGALKTADSLLTPADRPQPPVVLRDPAPGDLGWIIHRHGALYPAEFGWDGTFEHVVIDIIAGYLARSESGRDRCWVADIGGRIAGSVFLEHDSDDTAKLRLLYVEPFARGRGLGGTLVDACVAHARSRGYRRLTLWTMDVLAAARRVYESRGFVEVGRQPVRQFGKDLVSLTCDLDLTAPGAGGPGE